MASVLPTTIGCTDAHALVLPVLPTEELHLSLSSLEPKCLRMVILTIILVPLIALLIDHQNHVRFTAAQVIIALIYSSIHPASGRRRILRLGLHTIYTR